MDDRYQRTFSNKIVYFITKILLICSIAGINLLDQSLYNLVAFQMAAGLLPVLFYYEEHEKPFRRFLEGEVLMLCMAVCESLGVISLTKVLQGLGINIENLVMLRCLEVTFSKLILIFLYYLGISRMIRKSSVPASKTRYSIYIIILGYSLINMVVIVDFFMHGQESYLCAVNMGCIVLADLYLLYFSKLADEKHSYEEQIKILEQQAELQYEYYRAQAGKYDKTVQILHDLKKHIRSIETLYASGNVEMAKAYSKEAGELLKPLIPTAYTGNPIFDILLTDKMKIAREHNIAFQIEIEVLNLDGIDAMDITTIFGNLLDNALEAVEQADKGRSIYFRMNSCNEMIVVHMENESLPVKWKHGRPISSHGKERGIGLLNVQRSVEKYDGSLFFKEENGKFIVELFLNI